MSGWVLGTGDLGYPSKIEGERPWTSPLQGSWCGGGDLNPYEFYPTRS